MLKKVKQQFNTGDIIQSVYSSQEVYLVKKVVPVEEENRTIDVLYLLQRKSVQQKGEAWKFEDRKLQSKMSNYRVMWSREELSGRGD